MTSLTLTPSLVCPAMFVCLCALYIRFWPISGATIREARTSHSGSCFFGSHCTPQDCSETSPLGTWKGWDSYLGCCLVEGYYKWYQAQWWTCILFDGFPERSCSIKESFPWQNEIGHPFRQHMCRDYLGGYLWKAKSSKYKVRFPHQIQFLNNQWSWYRMLKSLHDILKILILSTHTHDECDVRRTETRQIKMCVKVWPTSPLQQSSPYSFCFL